MNVLIVDDTADSRILLSALVENNGHQAWTASNGKQAIEMSENELPDLVIMDIYMPHMNGYEAGIKIKQLEPNRYLPIIFLTGSTQQEDYFKCLEIGDDFINKPIKPAVLTAKLNIHSRALNLHQKVREQSQDLQRYKNHVDQEHEMVEHIFSQRFKDTQVDYDNIKYHTSSESLFIGDIFITVPSQSGGTYLLIGDITGKGLPAAVGTIPAHSAFVSMAKKGFNIGSIAAEMNTLLQDHLPDHMMLAATLIEINQQGNQLTVWSGGLPPSVITSPDGMISRTIDSRHAPLAALRTHEFLQDVETITLNPGERVYWYTDGITDSTNSSGEMFGEEQLFEIFQSPCSNQFDNLLNQLQQHIAGDSNGKPNDDITLVEFTSTPFPEKETEQNKEKRQQELEYSLPWNLSLHLEPEQLRNADPVPQIIKILSNAIGFDIHQDFISIILSELFNNALDHGLLLLDSDIKNSEEGFFEYYNMRSDRLKALNEGYIDIHIEHRKKAKKNTLSITVTDSGPGFQFDEKTSIKDDDYHGRGVYMLQELCQSLKYRNGGRTAEATYLIQ